jgi:predicted ATPase
LTDTLQEALGTRQLLLVLDNCEHLIDACARLADALLSYCPHLQILATSRQSLGLPGEISWAVPPLSLPVPAAAETPYQTPEALMEFEAIHLLVERAAAAPAAFALSGNNAAATVQVCRRLDGIPLAIELAAARLKALSIEQMAARLDDRFRLLTGGSRAALPRQQTLRATLDWSYDLLSEPERILLRRLAVFAGGFTLEAAEAVCADCGLRLADCGLGEGRSVIRNPQSASRNEEVLDLLASLVNQSLVRAERREGAMRYVLLETTRNYARERLEGAGRADEWRARHADYFLALAERAAPALRGGAQAEWLQRLEEEHDNFRGAIDHLLVHGPIEDGLRLGGALGWFWWMRGYLSEGRQRLQALLAESGYAMGASLPGSAGRVMDPELSVCHDEPRHPGVRQAQARALNAAGMLADDQSDYEAARALFLDSLALSRDLGDRLAAAMALNNLGGLAMQARDYPAARSLYGECLALSREVEDRWWTAAALTNLGRVTLLEGEYTTARAQIESALEIQRQLKDKRAIARSLTTLGSMAARLAEDGAARALLEESLALARELGAKGVIEETLSMLGSLAREGGDHDAALAFHEEHLTIAREVGSASGIAESLYDLGLVARDRGEGSRARTLWSESLAIYQELGNKQRIADCLEGFASLAAPPDPTEPGQRTRGSRGSRETSEGPDSALRAARLFGAAAALREVANAPLAARHRAEYERHLAAVRARLDPASFAAAWAEGQAMALDEAIAVALSQMGEH